MADADLAFAKGLAISTALHAEGDTGEAKQAYRDSLQSSRMAIASLEGQQAPELRAMLALSVGAIYYLGLDDNTAAEAWTRDAAKAYRQLGNAHQVALAQTMQGAALIDADPAQFPDGLALAVRLLRDSAQVHATLGDRREQAEALNYLGIALHYSGAYREAGDTYTAAMKVMGSLGRPTRLWQVMGNRALLDYELGNFDRARTTYAALLAQPALQSRPMVYVNILTNSALVDLVGGNAGQALKAYESGLDTARRIQSRQYEALCLQGIGGAYEGLGEPEQALEYYRRALALRTRDDGARFRQETLRTIADVERKLGNPSAALKFDTEALTLTTADLDRMRGRVRIAEDYFDLKRTPDALTQLESVLSRRVAGDRFVHTRALLLRGQVRTAAGEWRSAKSDLGEALQYAENLEWPDVQFRARLALVQMLRGQGSVPAALREVDAAISLAESLRLQTANPGLRASLLETLRPAFDLKIDLLAAQYAAAESESRRHELAFRALQVAESARARSLQEYARIDLEGATDAVEMQSKRRALYDQLSQFEARLDATAASRSGDENLLESLRSSMATVRRQIDHLESDLAALYSAPIDSGPATLVLDHWPEGLGLVEYWLGSGNAYAWVITRRQLRMVSLGPSTTIVEAARSTQRSLQNYASGQAAERMARLKTLGALIWSPLGPLLADEKTLVFVPDMALHYIPFSALPPASGSARFLIETRDVATAPSLRLLQEAGGVRKSGNGKLLLVADPDYGGSLPRLPASAREADAIAALMPTGTVSRLQGRQATRDSFLAADPGRYEYIHVASHAVTNARIPQLSALRLASIDSHGRSVDGDLLAADLLGVRLNARLVVLSACETSLGRVISGEGAIGLRYVFLARGARAVVSSLWPVSDRHAQQFMKDFYVSLLKGDETTAAALGSAMRSSIQRNGPDPALWAGFDLAVRNWGSNLRQ